MDEENKNIESVTESENDTVTEETSTETEEAAKETEEAAKETTENTAVAEEAPKAVSDASEPVNNTNQTAPSPIEVDNRKGMPRFALAAFLAVVVVLVAGILVLSIVLLSSRGGGRYYKQSPVSKDYPYANQTMDYDALSKKYSDTTGQSIAELADSVGLEYEELLMVYRLPKDFPKTMSENAAQAAIPVGRMCELRRSTLEAVKEEMGWGDDITETTPYGEALDKTPLKNAIGEEYVEEFKNEVGLGDDVTGDTLFGDIRPQYEKFMKDMTEKQNATPAPDSKTESAENETAESATEAAENASN